VSEPAPAIVFPVIVVGSSVAHLATPELDEDGAGYRAICPLAPLITRPLRRAKAGDVFVWCGSCRAWADEVGISLPRSR
jgi:hypothetical protein